MKSRKLTLDIDQKIKFVEYFGDFKDWDPLANEAERGEADEKDVALKTDV